jgi:hypothetical protein
MTNRRWIDGNDVAFNEYRQLLPRLASDFPLPNRVKDQDVLSAYRAEFDYCQVCGRSDLGIEVHHIIGGTKGRSDERTNLISLEPALHERVKTSELPQGLIMWCKWRIDPSGTDWVRLAILNRAFLPDLVESLEVAANFLQNRQSRRKW